MKDTLKKALKIGIQTMLYHDLKEWPPDCLGWIYQPFRPESKDSFSKQSVSIKSFNIFNWIFLTRILHIHHSEILFIIKLL